MRSIGELTKFLAKMAERREREHEPTIYSQMLEAAEAKKIDALDPNFESLLQRSVTEFVETAFLDMIQDICAKYALMLLEVRNQKLSADTGSAVDIVKLEEMAADQAEKFKVIMDILKAALKDIDWEHIAVKIIAAGKEVRAATENDNPFSNN